MLLLLKLIFVHLIADFVIQPVSWIKDKEQKAFRSKGLIWHTLVHALLYAMVLKFAPQYWLGFLILVSSHYLIDGLKCTLNPIAEKIEAEYSLINKRMLFVLDQLLHIAVILFVVNMYQPLDWSLISVSQEQIWLMLVALIMLTHVSSVVIKVMISRWTPLNAHDGEHSLANAGSFIGILERLFIFVFIITSHWEGVGFLLAAKSVFRFGDLKEAHDRKLTEYILIGTLISFGMALLIGMGYRYFSGLI